MPGHEAYYNEIMQKIHFFDLSNDIVLHGMTNEVTRLLSEIDVFVHTPDCQDGLPIVVFEAMLMVDTAEMTAKAALMRTESRGGHFRLDYPQRDDKNWLKNIYIEKADGQMKLWTEPIAVTKLPPKGDYTWPGGPAYC
jgi:aspartate oxidase